MKPLELNLARRPYRNDLPMGILLTVLLVGALAFTSVNVFTWVTADSTLENLKQEMKDFEGREAARKAEEATLKQELAKVDLEVLAPQAEFVDSVLQQRNFSWTMLFNALEEVLPWNVKLMMIRPRFETGKVLIRVQGMSRGYDGYLNFQDRLIASPIFDGVIPSGYEAGRDSESRLTFSLDFEYKAQEHRASQDAGVDLASGGDTVDVIVVEGEDEPGAEKAEPAGRGGVSDAQLLDKPAVPAEGKSLASQTPGEQTQPAGSKAGRRGRRNAGATGDTAAGTDRPRRGRRGNRRAGSAAGGAAGNATTTTTGAIPGAPVGSQGAAGAASSSSGSGLQIRRPQPSVQPGQAPASGAGSANQPTRRAVPGATGTEEAAAGRTLPEVPPTEIDRSSGKPQIAPAIDPNAPEPLDPRNWQPGEKPEDPAGGSEEGGSEGGGGSGDGGSGGGGDGGSGGGGSSS